MKKCYWSRLRVLTWAVLFAAGGFTSCSDDKGKDNPPPPPVELKNQIEYNGGSLIDIKSAIFDVEDTDLYTFYLSPTSGITDLAGMTAAKEYLRVAVRNPKGTVNTATDTFEISYKDIGVKKQTMDDVEKVQLSTDLLKETQQLNLYVEVTLKSGKTLLARYNSTCTEAVPQKLDNQFELNKSITAIGSVVEWLNPADGATTYYFYTQSDITAPSEATPAAMQITLAKGVDAASIDLAAADPEQVKITCGEFVNAAGTTGTLAIVKNGDATEVTVTLDARSGGSRLRAAYAGTYVSGYASTDRIKFTLDGTPEEAALTKVFHYKESLTNNFAFGLAEATTPEGLMAGNFAVKLGLSDLNIGRTIDLATEGSRCTFVLYDYRNYKTYDIAMSTGQGVTGTVTTAGTASRLYLRLSAAFPDGPAVEGEWFGDVTAVEAFDIVPVKPFVPHIKVLSAQGETVMDRDLSNVEVRLEKNFRLRGGDPNYGGAFFDAYFLYFRPADAGNASIEDTNYCPQLMIPASYLGSTDLNLAAPQDDLHWSFKYNNSIVVLQSEYSENYTMYGSKYGTCPDDVKATVIRNADKTWKITFTMTDSYPSTWNPERKEGTENSVTIEWEGPATKYSGTKKNDLTDTDY